MLTHLICRHKSHESSGLSMRASIASQSQRLPGTLAALAIGVFLLGIGSCWSQGWQITYLPPLEGSAVLPHAVNSMGMVAGAIDVGGHRKAVFWDGGGYVVIDPPPGFT